MRILYPDRKRHAPVGPAVSIACAMLTMVAAPQAFAQWTQFGGPGQDFKVDGKGIAEEWPAEGPRRLWERKLGEGYSAILANDDRLYTMYRAGGEETVICLAAATGKTLWKYAYEAPPAKGHDPEYGNGPNATPLLSDGRLYTIGVAGVMHCLDGRSGNPLWSRDLWGAFGGNVLEFGYSSSPIEYQGTVIVLVGGKEQSIVAFDKKSGEVAWKSLSFENSYSTPRIMRIQGEDQLVTFMATEVIGVDPKTGKLEWQYPIQNPWKQNICMPTLADDDLLFISSLEVGSRGLKLRKTDHQFNVQEAWSARKVHLFHVSSVRMGDYVYGSSGYAAAPFMSALNMNTGKIAWRKRGFARANVVGVGRRLIILDAKGILALATAGPEDLTVHSKVKLLEAPAWTVPTIVGTKLYMRDLKSIMALDLG